MKRSIAISFAVLGIPILLGFVSIAADNWDFIYDDAFITYRYAKNLALGHGITWNPGFPPTEGYTNFLLVILLAPFIKANLDPLLVTRVLSYSSAVAMAVIHYSLAKQSYAVSRPMAIAFGSLVLLAPQTRELSLVGLETVIYALFLLITFHLGDRLIRSRRSLDSVLFSTALFLTMLLRPEAMLIYIVVMVLYFIGPKTKQIRPLKPVIIGLWILCVLGGMYMTWKYLHFGHLIPNPFFLKATSSDFISPRGLKTVVTFFLHNISLIAVAILSMIYSYSGSSAHQLKGRSRAMLGFGFIFTYALFFVQAETIMDIGGRFMYPLVPILISMTIPILARVLWELEARTSRRLLQHAGIVLVFLITFGPNDLLHLFSNFKEITYNDRWGKPASVMQTEYRVAQALSAYPDIENLRIAFADSGVIPYFTGSIWLDVVGLNDSAIARTKDKGQLIDYFFDFEPDIVIQPGDKDLSWISHGHGRLGDYSSWSNDPRWDDYVYAGTGWTSGEIYNLQFMVRRSGPYYESVLEFLRTNVVDGYYDPFPFQLGSRSPNNDEAPMWIPLR